MGTELKEGMRGDDPRDACPFCGANTQVVHKEKWCTPFADFEYRNSVECRDCGAIGPRAISLEEAYERWRERANQPAANPQKDR